MSNHVNRKPTCLVVFALLLPRIEEASETHPFAEIEAKLDRISEQVHRGDRWLNMWKFWWTWGLTMADGHTS